MIYHSRADDPLPTVRISDTKEDEEDDGAPVPSNWLEAADVPTVASMPHGSTTKTAGEEDEDEKNWTFLTQFVGTLSSKD